MCEVLKIYVSTPFLKKYEIFIRQYFIIESILVTFNAPRKLKSSNVECEIFVKIYGKLKSYTGAIYLRRGDLAHRRNFLQIRVIKET